MRRLLASLLLLVPLFAAGQGVDAARPDVDSVMRLNGDTGVVWPGTQPSSFNILDAGGRHAAQTQYHLGSRWSAYFGASGSQGWPGAFGGCASASGASRASGCFTGLLASPRLMDSEVGASFTGNGYSVGMGVSSSKPVVHTSPLLPRVLPDSLLGHSGLPLAALDHSDNLNARGRVALGQQTGIDLGASVGRIRLLPGNLLGIDSLDQKSLSLGVDRGPLSGSIVGRVVQPQMGEANALGTDRRWTTVDLGVTWRLPWRGELSFGAQNVWSSGQLPKPKAGPEPDQSRMPYVQYHQDL